MQTTIDSGLQVLFSWQFLMFSLAISAIVFILKTILENAIPKILNSKWWNNVTLPISPAIIGALVAWAAKSFIYPDSLTNLSSRLMFGLSAGALSGLVYRVVRGAITQKITQEITTVTTTAVTQFPPPVVNVTTTTIPTNTAGTIPLPPLPTPPITDSASPIETVNSGTNTPSTK